MEVGEKESKRVREKERKRSVPNSYALPLLLSYSPRFSFHSTSAPFIL
jgi:hypothetical protein